MYKRNILITLLVFSILGFTVVNMSPVYAAEQGNNFFSSFIEKIASIFHLDKGQVQSVANTVKSEQKTKMQEQQKQREQDRLTKLVQDGKITETQKQAILNELTALKNKYDPSQFQSLTPEQRKQKMKDRQDELTSWAKSQGVDPSYLMMGIGRGSNGGKGMRRGGWQPKITPTQ